MLSQSEIFKQYPKKIDVKLRNFAEKTFMRNRVCSHPRQYLTVYVNESKKEDVRDFIINRNPDLALTINFPRPPPNSSIMNLDIYLKKLKEKVSHVNQIRFENLHRFFYNADAVV